MAHGRFERRKPIVEPNLIPLIDVSLILVIIFMVLTPALIQNQLNVRLPSATQGTPGEAETAVNVQIDARGNISLDGRVVKPAALETELALRLGKSSQKTVLVQSDKSVPVEKVVLVLDVAKKLGVGKLGLGVQKAER